MGRWGGDDEVGGEWDGGVGVLVNAGAGGVGMEGWV